MKSIEYGGTRINLFSHLHSTRIGKVTNHISKRVHFTATGSHYYYFYRRWFCVRARVENWPM